jgi:hypothetical protein
LKATTTSKKVFLGSKNCPKRSFYSEAFRDSIFYQISL